MSQSQFEKKKVMKPLLIPFEPQFLVNYSIMQMQPSSYLPDLALCNFFLFPNLKIYCNGKNLGCERH